MFDPDFQPDQRVDENGTQWQLREGVWCTVTKSSDPAMMLLNDPNIRSIPNPDIYNPKCYICVDPEFAAMGLPLCYPCELCGGHVAADDVECDKCGADQYELWEAKNGG